MAVELSPEVIAASTSMTANGLWPTTIPFTSFWTVPSPPGTVAQPIAGSATADTTSLFLAYTPYTNLYLQSATYTEDSSEEHASTEFVLPQNYVAGEDITVTITADWQGASTDGEFTYTGVNAYKVVPGDNLLSVDRTPATRYIAKTPTEYTFVIDGATLSPGDRLVLVVLLGPESTVAASPVFARIYDITVS